MKKLLTFGASALALSVAVTGTAQAQSTIEAEIGAGLITLIDDEFAAGIGLNMALNTARIDGAVTVDQNNLELDFLGEGSFAFGNDDGPFNIGGAAVQVDFDEEVAKVNIGEVSTLAVGAINDGTVRFGQAGSSSDSFGQLALSAGDVEVVDDVVSSAANTSNTAAAYYEADFYASVGSFTGSLTESLKTSAYGPAQDFFAMNVAFNNTDIIDGSIDVTGNGISATTMGTTVAGAINTGVIESGLCSGACGN